MGVPVDVVVDAKDRNTLHLYVDGGFCYSGWVRPPAEMELPPYEVRERPGVRFLIASIPDPVPSRLDAFPSGTLAPVSFRPAAGEGGPAGL